VIGPPGPGLPPIFIPPVVVPPIPPCDPDTDPECPPAEPPLEPPVEPPVEPPIDMAEPGDYAVLIAGMMIAWLGFRALRGRARR